MVNNSSIWSPVITGVQVRWSPVITGDQCLSRSDDVIMGDQCISRSDGPQLYYKWGTSVYPGQIML